MKYKNSEEAKKRSKINTDNAALKKHYHRLGGGGYRAAKPKWNQMERELVEKDKTPETFDWDERLYPLVLRAWGNVGRRREGYFYTKT